MRTVTVSFVTVIELTAPCWTRSNRNKMKPLLISITSFLQEVLTATGRPVRYRPLGRLFYCSTTLRVCQRISRRGGSARAPPCTSQVIRPSSSIPTFAHLGDGRGKRKRRVYDYWEKGSRNFEAFKMRLPFHSVLIGGIGRSPSALETSPTSGICRKIGGRRAVLPPTASRSTSKPPDNGLRPILYRI